MRKRVDGALALAAFLLMHRGRLLDDGMSLASLKKLLAQPYFWDLYELERATQKARGDNAALAAMARLRRRVQALRGVDVKPKPLLNGHDLIGLNGIELSHADLFDFSRYNG